MWANWKAGILWLTALGLLLEAAMQKDGPKRSGIRKLQISNTIRANVYADNWYSLYINRDLVAVDSIQFIPHNVISVDILPTYPMTIAVLAKDNADPKTGMEYANTNIGDGGFVPKFGDGTVTNGRWKAKCFSHGPVRGDTQNPQVIDETIPEHWFGIDFDDAAWHNATEYSEEQVNPKQPYLENDFGGAKFIWSSDLALDNIVCFRHVVSSPPDGKTRADFSNLNNLVPDQLPRRKGRGH